MPNVKPRIFHIAYGWGVHRGGPYKETAKGRKMQRTHDKAVSVKGLIQQMRGKY